MLKRKESYRPASPLQPRHEDIPEHARGRNRKSMRQKWSAQMRCLTLQLSPDCYIAAIKLAWPQYL
jgi:hypothetical protein